MAEGPKSIQQKANDLHQILGYYNGLEVSRRRELMQAHMHVFYVIGMEWDYQLFMLRNRRYENLSLVVSNGA